MKLAEAFSVAVEEVNAVNPALRLEAVKRYLTIDDSIVLQDLCKSAYYTITAQVCIMLLLH